MTICFKGTVMNHKSQSVYFSKIYTIFIMLFHAFSYFMCVREREIERERERERDCFDV